MNKTARTRSRGLGRGLDALLGGDPPPVDPGLPADGPMRTLSLDALQAGRYQPRTRMDEASLEELAASIRSHGIMQPVVVRPVGAGRWEIIAGERRVRAAALAGLDEVPVIVRDVSDEQALELALIENLQREDLNPLEQAHAIRRLIDEFGYSHERAAEILGRSRSATTNLLRLLQLAEPVQTMLLAGDIDMGHARALLALESAQQPPVAQRVVDGQLSVRQTEKLVQRVQAGLEPAFAAGARRAAVRPDRDLERLQTRIADALAAPVSLHSAGNGRGRMTIRFTSHEQLLGVLERLGIGHD